MTLLTVSKDGQPPTGATLISGKDGSGNAQDVLVDTSGVLQVNASGITGLTTFGSLQHTVATGTATAMAANACRVLTLKSSIDNSAAIYIGATGVTSATGDELYPGDTRSFELSNTNIVFSISATASQKLTVSFAN